MQRQGMAAECSRRGARSRIHQGLVALNKRLKEPCPSKSQDLRTLFG